MPADKYRILGRIVSAIQPEMAEELINKYASREIELEAIPLIYDQILEQFPAMADHEAKEMLIAITYRLYCPASFLPPLKQEGKDAQAVAKLPPGVRGTLANCLGFRHAEEINRYKGYTCPFIKNPRYVKKMQSVANAVGLDHIDLSL